MTTSTLAFGRASAFGSRKAWKTTTASTNTTTTRTYSSLTSPRYQSSNGGGAATTARPVDSAVQRGLVVDVLTANATKRDAKQYLARFGPRKPGSSSSPTNGGASAGSKELSAAQEERNSRHRINQDRLDRLGVNLGGLYAPARAIAESPQFTKVVAAEEDITITPDEFHIALVCLRAPETLDDATLDGMALTLAQLVKLDMRIVLVLDCGARSTGSGANDATLLKTRRRISAQQGERICAALGRHESQGGRILSSCLECSESFTDDATSDKAEEVSVSLPKLLMDPLNRGIIPIIPSLAYTATGKLTQISLSSAMTALTQEISKPTTPKISTTKSIPTSSMVQSSLDRIIILDSLGGIPSKVRGDGAHVFINLQQEYDDITAELADYGETHRASGAASPLYEQHQTNLRIARDCLALLPAASSALIVTPQEAATSSQTQSEDRHTLVGAGTRRQKNTLIHNLLTNKPTVSSSLPVARLTSAAAKNADTKSSSSNGGVSSLSLPTSTLLKRGMPLTIIPAIPHGGHWRRPEKGTTQLSLENDPRVDLPRLVHLIESSFRRKLDVQDYLARIRNRLAGLIIAGEYEGGAILTWEIPPSALSQTSVSANPTKQDEEAVSPARLVPYLDKFAVLPSSQGSSGVADVVFQAMVRTCLPEGVCWRSRRDNPVNKWYFERSAGTWEIPGSQWTMFWTGDGVVQDRGRWEDYVGVCRGVQPSWADGKKPD